MMAVNMYCEPNFLSKCYFKVSTISPQTFLIFRGFCHIFIFNATQLVSVPNLKEIMLDNWILLIARSSISSFAIAVSFFCLKHVPLSIYAVIYELAPLFAVIMSAVILKECVPPIEIFVCVTALLGTILVIQPPSIFVNISQTSTNLNSYDFTWMLIATSVPMFISTNFVLLRKMGTQTKPVPVSVSTFCLAIGCLVAGLLLQLLIGESDVCFDYVNLLYLLLMTLASILNQVFSYYANKFEKSPIVALVLTAKVPILLTLDFTLFPNEAKSYNWMHYLGGGLVVASVLALLVCNYFKMSEKFKLFCQHSAENNAESEL